MNKHRKRRPCVECGRPISVRRLGKVRSPKKDDHDLCWRCWKAHLDRNRPTK